MPRTFALGDLRISLRALFLALALTGLPLLAEQWLRSGAADWFEAESANDEDGAYAGGHQWACLAGRLTSCKIFKRVALEDRASEAGR